MGVADENEGEVESLENLQATTGATQATKSAADLQAERTLQLILEAADEQKARDIVVLDVRGQTIVADYFVMCSGTSTTHISAIAESVQDRLREVAKLRAKPEGDSGSFWMILDYSDVILHVFAEETREFYDLERLWADAVLSHYPQEAESDQASANGAALKAES